MANLTNPHSNNLLGQSRHFHYVLEQISQLAPLDKPVLVIGERGTGKELIAERLHFLSRRWDQPYLKLNCAALNENLLESELFGHESGAFTGAAKRHLGRFERADQGCLFLDELANTSQQTQEKLLRVIEYGEFERLGGSQTLRTDVRLICATNEDLPTLTEQGRFRADLLDRLAFDVITLPPLRARHDDILLLAEHFAIGMVRQLGLSHFAGFSLSAQQTLLDYHWPGNIRELKNTVERSVYRQRDPKQPLEQVILDPFDSPWRTKTAANKENVEKPRESGSSSAVFPALPLDFKQHCQQAEMALLQHALTACHHNQKQTAEQLGLTYHQLRGLLKKYQLFN